MPHRLDKLDSAPLQVGLGLYEIWHGIDHSNFILKVHVVIPNVVIPLKCYSDWMEVVFILVNSIHVWKDMSTFLFLFMKIVGIKPFKRSSPFKNKTSIPDS